MDILLCATHLSHLFETTTSKPNWMEFYFLDSEKEKEAEGGGFGPGAYINGSAVSENM